MAAVSDELFCDDDLKEMYDPANGRLSPPPSLMCRVLLLQFYTDVSDYEATQRLQFDLRWQVALHLPTDFPAFDPSSLTYFRRRLIEHQQERYAFDRFITVGRAAGFIPDRVTLLTDTTRAKGAGAVQDSYTLLRKGIRQLLKQLGYAMPGQGRGLAPETQRLVATYLQQDRKASIDWADPAQRAAQLQVLYQDAELALDLVAEAGDDAEARVTGWLLAKILGDDVELDDEGRAQIAEGTAPDRIVSFTEPEMRHGHKSSSQRFDGFKVAVSTEETSELILDIADITALGSDGKELMPTIERVEQHLDVTVERTLADGAYGSGSNRAACAERPNKPVDLLAPMARPSDPEVAKPAFAIDLEALVATCPQGHTAPAKPGAPQAGLPTWRFRFPRATCQACPLFERCVKSKTAGRTVQTHPYEAELQAARQRQRTDEFKLLYSARNAVERKQAELVQHGLRGTRYLGQAKRQLQRLWLAAAINLKRLFKLADAKDKDLARYLSQMRSPRGDLALG
jgi:hypothetical protein